MKTMDVVRFLASFVLSFAVIMLIIVGGSKLIEMWGPYYGSRFEMTLAIMTIGVAAYMTANALPERLYKWVQKDD